MLLKESGPKPKKIESDPNDNKYVSAIKAMMNTGASLPDALKICKVEAAEDEGYKDFDDAAEEIKRQLERKKAN